MLSAQKYCTSIGNTRKFSFVSVRTVYIVSYACSVSGAVRKKGEVKNDDSSRSSQNEDLISWFLRYCLFLAENFCDRHTCKLTTPKEHRTELTFYFFSKFCNKQITSVNATADLLRNLIIPCQII